MLQVRMMLEDTSEAMLDASRNSCPVPHGTDAGVYVGCVSFEYATVLERAAMKVHMHCNTAFPRLFSSYSHRQSFLGCPLNIVGNFSVQRVK